MQVFLVPFDIHEIVSKAELPKIWSDTYKKSPFCGQERKWKKALYSLEWEYILTPEGASVLNDGEEKEGQSNYV